MRVFLSILFLFICNVLSAQNEKYYIFQCEKINDVNTINHATINKKCYVSKITKKFYGDIISIKTDSINFDYYVLRRINSRKILEIYAAKYNKSYYLREYHVNNHYYLIIMPIRLHVKNKHLDGTGIMLIVSTDSNICDYYNMKLDSAGIN